MVRKVGDTIIEHKTNCDICKKEILYDDSIKVKTYCFCNECYNDKDKYSDYITNEMIYKNILIKKIMEIANTKSDNSYSYAYKNIDCEQYMQTTYILKCNVIYTFENTIKERLEQYTKGNKKNKKNVIGAILYILDTIIMSLMFSGNIKEFE